MAEGRPTLQIPRWIQLVGLPVLALVAWALAGTLGHAIFLFLTASVIAFLLNPIVREVQRSRVPRGIAVAVVFIFFAAAVTVGIVALGTVVVDQTRSAADRVDAYLTDEPGRSGDSAFDRDVADFESWLHDRGIDVELRDEVDQALADVNVSGLTQDAISFAQGAAFGFVQLLFSIILIIVISVYMLLDMPKLERAIDRRFPPHGSAPLTLRIESALAGYVRGQLLLSAIIGTSAGVGMWVLGALDLVPGADRYALLFGLWTAVIEVIPYIGPWLSAVPPAIYALVVDPVSVFWVAALFIFIYQVEGHVVVPNVMANALRLHPLLVIFGLLAGAELYGIAGILVALPLLAAARAIWEFFGERVTLEPWGKDSRALPVEVEVDGPPTDVTLVP
ncbi:MAG TPA: AI-2E family transporter [Gaiellaceae bacterium]|jgi:predicted PurR-regulated permease PerM